MTSSFPPFSEFGLGIEGAEIISDVAAAFLSVPCNTMQAHIWNTATTPEIVPAFL